MTPGRGRDALFEPVAADPHPRPAADGRRALFSAPPRRKGTVVVECGRCQARSPIPFPELGVKLLPSVWVPGRAFSRLMRCPACGRPSWCRVHWRSLFS